MASIDKIIFLIQSHFNERDYHRFGLPVLMENGFEVEVWDCTAFLTPEEFDSRTPPDPFHYRNLRIFRKRYEAVEALHLCSPGYFAVALLDFNPNSLPIFQALTRKGISYCLNTSSLLLCTPFWSRNLKRISRFNWDWLKSFALRKIPLGLLGIKPVDFLLAHSERFIRQPNFPVGKSTEILWVGSLDYDRYLELKGAPAEVAGEYGVFIDEFLPFHPDNLYLGVPTIKPEDYYPKLNSFFDFLEGAYRIRIVIAAHPRADYENRPKYYGDRPVLRGKTINLIKDASLVVMHQSLAINYAVLFKKPLIFITTDLYDRGRIEDPSVYGLAEHLGKTAHNLDKSLKFDIDKELSVDEAAYRRYRNDYIVKDGTPEKFSWQIVADRLKKIQ